MSEHARPGGPARETAPRPLPTVPCPDAEKQQQPGEAPEPDRKASAFKALGWLDRYLAVWIFLAMAAGILIGNFAPDVDEILQRGRFVGVSVPIGKPGRHSISCTASVFRAAG